MFSDWVVELSHWQFVLLGGLHALFVPLTLGLGSLLAMLETADVFSGKPRYRTAIHFWQRLFALNVVLLIASRLPLLLAGGMYGAYFSHYAGDVFALPLALETLTSLTAVAILFGPYWFGWNTLRRFQHLIITWLIVIALHGSLFWITVSSVWLQNPVGAAFDPSAYRLQLVDFNAVLDNPLLMGSFIHQLAACHAAAAGAVLAISAYRLRRDSSDAVTQNTFKWAACWGLLAVFATAWPQDSASTSDTTTRLRQAAQQQGAISPELQQAMKEHIQSGIEAYSALQILRDDNPPPEAIATFNAHRDDLGYAWLLKPWHKPIVGASDKQIQHAVQSALPSHPQQLYWLHKAMMGCGILSLVGFGWSAWQGLSRHPLSAGGATISLYVAAFPWLSGMLGLYLAIGGQQPWIIAGQLPGVMGLSSTTSFTLLLSLGGYLAIYALMLATAVQLLKQWLASPAITTGANA